MKKAIRIIEIIANSLLLVALIMSLLHIPNQALLIVAGIAIMMCAGLPLLNTIHWLDGQLDNNTNP